MSRRLPRRFPFAHLAATVGLWHSSSDGSGDGVSAGHSCVKAGYGCEITSLLGHDSTSWFLARMLILPPHKPVACMSHLVLGWATMNWGHALAYGLHSHVYLGAVGSYAPYRIVWCHLEGGSNFCGFHPFLQPLISLGPKHQVPFKTSHWHPLASTGPCG